MKTECRHRELGTDGQDNLESAASSAFTVEESIVMRAFVAGRSDRQVRTELRIPLQSFLRLVRNLMEKTGTRDRIGLLVWGLRGQCSDRRESERSYKWRRPA